MWQVCSSAPQRMTEYTHPVPPKIRCKFSNQRFSKALFDTHHLRVPRFDFLLRPAAVSKRKVAGCFADLVERPWPPSVAATR